MGEIFYKLRINGNDRTSVVNAFLDTGSTHNVIRYDLPDGKLTLDLAIFYDEHGAKDMEVIGNKEPQTLGTVLFNSIEIGGITIRDPKYTTFILENIGDDAIIGFPLMQYLEMVLDFRMNKDTAQINYHK